MTAACAICSASASSPRVGSGSASRLQAHGEAARRRGRRSPQASSDRRAGLLRQPRRQRHRVGRRAEERRPHAHALAAAPGRAAGRPPRRASARASSGARRPARPARWPAPGGARAVSSSSRSRRLRAGRYSTVIGWRAPKRSRIGLRGDLEAAQVRRQEHQAAALRRARPRSARRPATAPGRRCGRSRGRSHRRRHFQSPCLPASATDWRALLQRDAGARRVARASGGGSWATARRPASPGRRPGRAEAAAERRDSQRSRQEHASYNAASRRVMNYLRGDAGCQCSAGLQSASKYC